MMTPEERQQFATRMMTGARDTLRKISPSLKVEFVQRDLNDDYFDFTLNNIPFSISWSESLGHSILGVDFVVQFSLCVWHETNGSWFNPPESIDTELVVTRYINECVKKALMTVFESEINVVLENNEIDNSLVEEKI